jgi:hypothetical protein
VRRVVGSDSKNGALSDFHQFVLSLTMHAKRRVAVWRIVATHIVARLKLNDWLISQVTCRHRDNAPHDNTPFGVLR